MKKSLLVALLFVCAQANAGLIGILARPSVLGTAGLFDILYNDTGDGLLRLNEIVDFTGVTLSVGDPDVDGFYRQIVGVPNIPGVASGSGGNGGDSWDMVRDDGKLFSSPASDWRYSLSQDVEATRTVDRDVDLWFGTLSIVGVDAPSTDFLQLSSLVANDLRVSIEGDVATDARLKNNSTLWAPWIQPNVTGLEWTIDSGAPLNAQQNLQNAYAAAAASLEASFGPGSLTLLGLTARDVSYLLGTFDSLETAPVFVGDTDNPTLFGDEGHIALIHDDFVGNVHYFAQNATWTANVVTVPEPGTLSMLVSGLLLAWRTRRTIGLSDPPNRRDKTTRLDDQLIRQSPTTNVL